MQLQYCFINAKVTKHHTGYRRWTRPYFYAIASSSRS